MHATLLEEIKKANASSPETAAKLREEIEKHAADFEAARAALSAQQQVRWRNFCLFLLLLSSHQPLFNCLLTLISCTA